MFITFEGSEGTGKSTQIRLLTGYLEQFGHEVVTTREPGGTTIGEQVRLCLHDVANQNMTAAAEALLYSASRSQLVEEVIRPALARGCTVLSDRYADSTLAYQGYGRGLDLAVLKSIMRLVTGGLVPDLTFLLDLDVQIGLGRRTTDAAEMNRMDLQTVAFYERVRRGYWQLAEEEPERWVIIDANRPVEQIQADLRAEVGRRLRLPADG